MTASVTLRAALAAATLLFVAGDAPAQGLFDLFGDDRPARAPRPSRDIPGSGRKRAAPKPKRVEAARPAAGALVDAAKPAAAGPDAPPPPYEPQMIRLTEVLGALSFLRDLCGAGDGDDWRTKMTALLDAEAPSGARRERLVASFNRGFRGYELTYRSCTPNAKIAIARYLDEASRISNDITYRFGSP
jgi:uncharacterized protein (TIGR02301 family)